MTRCLLGILAAAALAAGCQDNYDVDGDSAVRSEGDLALSPTEIQRSPYSPILGYTTGGGLSVNRSTGGGISGNDVTPLQQLDARRGIPSATPASSAAPLPPAPAPTNAPTTFPSR